MTEQQGAEEPEQVHAQADQDPGAPQSTDAQTLDLTEAIALANGLESDKIFDVGILETLAVPTIQIDWNKAAAFYTACITSNPRVGYALGIKIPGDTARPGIDFKHVDCSGFIRAVIRRSSTPLYPFPDGSVVQHDWIKAKGFTPLARGDAALVDGKVRIAFLEPADSPQHIGHVVLLHNGHTLESHGGTGPNRRPWTGTGWQAKSKVYMVDPT